MREIEVRFIGSMIGTFVGDALGRCYEGFNYDLINTENISNPQQDARYTDDTQMMIGLAESLIECKGFEGADVAEKFMKNFDPIRGYGSGAVRIMQRLMAGVSWKRSGSNIFPGGSYGNGSAMRIAPVGLLYHNDRDKLIEITQLSSVISHTHPMGKLGAILQAYSVTQALNYGLSDDLNTMGMVDKLKSVLPSDAEVFHDKLNCIKQFLNSSPSPDEVITNLGNGIASFNSVPAAIYSFLANANSFENAVTFAISLGGDTDTIGAMTGAISGAYHGYKCIPERWLDVLENGHKGRDYVIRLARELYKTWVNLNSGH